ncbi:MAG: signal peptidase I [Clostridia bacterium]
MQEELTMLTAQQIEKELGRITYKKRYTQVMRSTIFILAVVAAVAILIATMFLPVLNVYGTSMTPTFEDGDIVVCIKKSDFEAGELVAFYYNNKILVKRVIATSGQWVDIDDEGNVTVDGELLDEPYLEQKALGECNIEFPYQVPDGRYFVMGDNRSISADSRIEEIGCISQEEIVGEIIFRVFPFNSFGLV